MDFEPGSRYAYSNFGYCLLGRVIESVSGQSYEKFVTDRILKPCGMTQTRLGKTRLNDRAKMKFCTTCRRRKCMAIWDVMPGNKSAGLNLLQGRTDTGIWKCLIHGGWTSTAADLVRFAVALDSANDRLISPQSLALLKSPPTFLAAGDSTWYGLGWSVLSVNETGGVNLWGTGLIAGTSTILIKRFDNLTWAVLFNADGSKDDETCSASIDSSMHSAVDQSIPLLLAPAEKNAAPAKPVDAP